MELLVIGVIIGMTLCASYSLIRRAWILHKYEQYKRSLASNPLNW